ncbi:MAG TPA: hypothetical protein H9717_02385 [Candidatus Eisenbergiella merdipullorum]|uniref:Uncharacterized protein n=1 Tax=Candidatus Eisenbergiella merdipullorum TaxID=2838553 RepID=A0A9D2KXY9_9FIRM|nr:hypothetical protein [Candidatus Eisenbergiella merdipullorum]
MENEERRNPPFVEEGRNEEPDLVSLRYEVASAKRQIGSLQAMIAKKNREAAYLKDQLIEKDVLLKEAAACIGDALALCREQLSRLEKTSRLYMSYEMEWQAINARLSKMKDQLPEIPACEEPGGNGKALEEVRNRVGARMESAGENLRRMFEE